MLFNYPVTNLVVQEKYAWIPVKSSSGKWIWRSLYYRFTKKIYGPAGESPIKEYATMTRNEFLIWQMSNPKTEPKYEKVIGSRPFRAYY